MGTPYGNIYDRFLTKVTDYGFSNQSSFESKAIKFLRSAIPKFIWCRSDLTMRDDSTQAFSIDLSEYEEEILSIYMVQEWIRPQINDLGNIRLDLGSREFQVTSQANHLDKLVALKKDMQEELTREINKYHYSGCQGGVF